MDDDLAQDESHNEEEDEDDDKKFQSYDPVLWETAAEEKTVEKAPDKEEAPISYALETSPGTLTSETLRALQNTEEYHEEEVERSASPERKFVRALKDSQAGSKPYFQKGDILRVINRAHHGKFAGKSDTSEAG